MTVRATSFSASSFRRVFKSLSAIFVPYFPASGDVLTLIDTPMRGSSIFKQGILFSGKPSSTSVWVTRDEGNPERSTISPA
jgi:hypothetical protein